MANTAIPQIPIIYGPNAPPPTVAQPSKKGPRSFILYHDNQIPLWSSWDVPSIMTALDEHTLGQFFRSGMLADAMTMDDAFDSVLQTRVLGLLSRPFDLKASPRGNRTKARIALRVLREKWDAFFPEHVLSALMQGYLQMGFQHSQLIWRYSARLWDFSVQPWHGSTAYYDQPTRHYVTNTQEGQVYIKPGTGHWVLVTPFGSYRGWLRGAVRAVAIPWAARQYALRDWARYNEVHGLPIKKAKVPAGAPDQDKATFTQGIGNLGNETTVMLPQGLEGTPATSFDLDLLEAKADTWEAFEGMIEKCETRMAIRLLGQNLTTEISAGSLAAANVHDRVRLDYTRFDANTLQTAIREQILKPWAAFNFGDPELAPVPVWDTSPPEDKQGLGRIYAEVGTTILNLANAQAPVDKRKFLEKVGVPVLPEGEAVPPPPAGKDGGGDKPKAPPGAKPDGSPGITQPKNVTRSARHARARAAARRPRRGV